MYVLPLLALAGNSLTLLVFITNTQLNRSSFSVYVKSMAVTDTLVLLFKLISYLNKTAKYFYAPWLCTILIFCGEASVLLSIWTIALITIERTLVVLFPLHTKKLLSVSRARVLTVIMACVALAFSARILIIPIDVSPQQRKRCYPVTDWQPYRKLNATITEFGYCYIPLAIVIVGNFLTLYTVKRALFNRQHVLTNNAYCKTRAIDVHENQLMLMLLMVTVMFIVYFVPYTITNAMARWGLPFGLCFTQRAFKVYLLLRSISELLKDLNFCTNFIIYCISGRRFRYALISLIKNLSRAPAAMSGKVTVSRQLHQRLLNINYGLMNFHALQRHTIDESQF